MALRRLTLIRGDSHLYTLLFRDNNKAPLCLKNWIVFFTLKTNQVYLDSQASLQKIVTTFSDTTGGTSGITTINILPADTINLDPREYDFDISVTTAAGDHKTVMIGKLNLEHDITRSLGTAGTAI